MQKTYNELTNDEIFFILHNYRLQSNMSLSEMFDCVDIPIIIQTWRQQANRRVALPRIKYEDTHGDWRREVADYYLQHSPETTKRYFCITSAWLQMILAEFEIPEQDRSTALYRAKIDKYGSIDSYNAQVLEHMKETCLDRYGVDNYSKTAEFREKSTATFMNHYGVSNPMKSDSVKAKVVDTTRERYGVDWAQQNSKISEKTSQTCVERYGGRGWASNYIRSESIETHEERYGSTHWRGSELLTAKVNATCREKHNVDWPCQYPEVKQGFVNDSKPNKAFEKLLVDNGIQYEREFGIGSYSYDFKVNNVLIEVDPSATHNSTWGVFGCEPTDKNYHSNKSQTAIQHGYRCIHLFDWDNVDLVIKQLLKRPRVYARQCDIDEVDANTKKSFVTNHHIQKDVKSEINIGLYYNDELVSVMTFGKPRYNKNYQYELLRYCSRYQVVGGAEKLFNYFVKTYAPKSIISYCDTSKFTGKVYEHLGMIKKSLSVSKHWYNISTGKHITDNLLRQRGLDQLFGTNYGKGTNNEDLMRKHGFVEIFDAGQATYVWNR